MRHGGVERVAHLFKRVLVAEQAQARARDLLGRLPCDRAARAQEEILVVLLAARDRVNKDHRQAHRGRLGHADAAGLCEVEVSGVHQKRHVLHIRTDVDVFRIIEAALEPAVELLVCAADDGQVLIVRQVAPDAARDAHDGAAAHAAAHHYEVLVVSGDAERALGVLLAHAGAEHLAHGDAAGAQAFARHAAAEEIARERRGRDKVAVERAVLHAGRTGVVRGDEAGLEVRQVRLHDLADHQRRERVGADDRVVPAAGNEAAELFRALRQIAVERGTLVKLRGMILRRAVAHAEKTRRVAVDAHVPVRDKARDLGRDEAQGVLGVAGNVLVAALLLERRGAGVVPLAGVAA